MTASGGAAAMELVRSLIEAIRLVPENGASLRIELRGELAAILGLASGTNADNGCREAAAVTLSQQVKVVAGTGFEPVTFRL